MAYEIVEAKEEHLHRLAKNLRPQDREELKAQGYRSTPAALGFAFRRSILRKVALVDGHPAAFWGVFGELVGGQIGIPFLFTTHYVERHPVAFLKEGRKQVCQMLEHFPALQNYVWARYPQALRALAGMGFNVEDPAPRGDAGEPFCRIWMERAAERTLVVRRCTVQEAINNPAFPALAQEYYAESSIAGLPDPTEKMHIYNRLERSKSFQAYGAFIGDELIGFAVVLTPVIPHYGVAISVMESLFVAKAHRKTGAGLQIIRAAEDHARHMESPALMISSPFNGALARVLPRRGYRETNRVFIKAMSHG